MLRQSRNLLGRACSIKELWVLVFGGLTHARTAIVRNNGIEQESRKPKLTRFKFSHWWTWRCCLLRFLHSWTHSFWWCWFVDEHRCAPSPWSTCSQASKWVRSRLPITSSLDQLYTKHLGAASQCLANPSPENYSNRFFLKFYLASSFFCSVWVLSP